MNHILDIHELVQENKKQENNKLEIFESVLTQCHDLIKRHNKNRIREMEYTLPAFILGKPSYDINILRNYLVYHLRDNGLKVEIINLHQIYISWREEDIDISKFVHRKTLIDNRKSSFYMVDNDQSIEQSRIDMLKFRQERQRQIQEERKQRFQLQRESRPPPPDVKYKDYLRGGVGAPAPQRREVDFLGGGAGSRVPRERF